jgi:hypothetical protein
MNMQVQFIPEWQIAAMAIAFTIVTLLFLLTAQLRNRLEGQLRGPARAAPKTDVPRLMSEPALGRTSNDAPAPSIPERLWTYDSALMTQFIESITPRGSDGARDCGWLAFYAGPILSCDIAFAASFAAAISLTGVFLMSDVTMPIWLVRLAPICSAMGLVYGAADIAEDLKLRRIFRDAQRHLDALASVDATDRRLCDAASVDAANVLTRVKVVSLTLSVIGLVVWTILMGAAQLIFRPSTPDNPLTASQS